MAEPEPRARIIEIGGRSQALGGEVLLRLAEPFTVLVGRNGVGKSALMHLIYDAALQACGARSERHLALLGDEFQCTVEIAGTVYQYTASSSKSLSAQGEFEIEWSEVCLNTSTGAKLWSTKAGGVDGPTTQFFIPPFTGLLAHHPSMLPDEIAPIASKLGTLFRRVLLVPAGLPATEARGQATFMRDPGTGKFDLSGRSGSPRLDRVARQLMRWHQNEDESFARVENVLRRIGVCEKLEFKTYPELPIGLIFIDGYPLEAASDGTLRVLELVVTIEVATVGALVMIEEPETGIHPALCDRIMAEIGSAADSLQLIISTHSPRILDQVEYRQVRHVRRNGSARIEALTPEQVKAVKVFLSEEGTLGEFVFSEIFEDDE